MIRDREYWEQWERERQRCEAPDFARNLRLVEALAEEAKALGVWERKDPLEGIEVKIHLAKVVNSISG